MPLIAYCDAPGCSKSAKASLAAGRVVIREEGSWWAVNNGQEVIIACCDKHLDAALGLTPYPYPGS